MTASALKKISLSTLVIVSVITLSGFSCKARPENSPITANVKLVMWGLWEESSYLEPIISSFTEQTGIEISYKKIASVADYEKKLLKAFATGRGPDIFTIHHTWVDRYKPLISPASAETIDERILREEFVDVVAQDMLKDGAVYGLPISVDTLALYYNKDLFNEAGIAQPPKTWDQFQEIVEKLTKVDRFGNIQQSGAALGTAANVNRAPDILQLLMMQSGLPIAGADYSVDINNETSQNSLTFYTDFSNKTKKVYTWNLQQDYSVDSFASGKSAMMLSYAYQMDSVKAKNPRLNFNIAPMPQIADSKTVNFASYWPYAVSSKSSSPTSAWRFVHYLTNAESAALVSKNTSSPPARRDSITSTARDPILGVFAEQSLTAASWPRSDITATDAIFNSMIDSIVTGGATASEALGRAQEQINHLNQPAPEEKIDSGNKAPSLNLM